LKLYEPLIERDLNAIPDAVRAFLDHSSPHELFLAVARFAVLAYAPSQHSKRAVMACRAAWDLREAMGERWSALLTECARYAAEARRPWSEPPILDALESPDEDELRARARGDALLMLDTALALLPILGEKGKGALLRMPVQELEAEPNPPDDSGEPIEALVQHVVDANGSVDTVREVFIWAAKQSLVIPSASRGTLEGRAVPTSSAIYHLARDYAQTVIAHATPLPEPLREPFLSAVHHNLQHGESFAEWSFA
jgi:hypothetical protein